MRRIGVERIARGRVNVPSAHGVQAAQPIAVEQQRAVEDRNVVELVLDHHIVQTGEADLRAEPR